MKDTGPRRTRPEFVEFIADSEPQEFPDDPVTQESNLESTMERAREEGTLRRRAR